MGATPAKAVSAESKVQNGTAKENGADAKPKQLTLKFMERGVGRVHINTTADSARILMRMKGTHAVLLNTPVFGSTRYEPEGKKSVRFTAFEGDGKQFKTYRLNLGNTEARDNFVALANAELQRYKESHPN